MAKDKYSLVEDNLITIEGWVRDGATNEEIAKRLGIGKTTFYKYIAEHSELSELLKKGKGIVDTQVENALLKRAMGYKYEETTQELRDGEMVVTKVVVKEVAPDTTAQIFWLK
ncbi:MAG: helix-turn-helix domain-containing protein, partial [Bradymonadales bacterium]